MLLHRCAVSLRMQLQLVASNLFIIRWVSEIEIEATSPPKAFPGEQEAPLYARCEVASPVGPVIEHGIISARAPTRKLSCASPAAPKPVIVRLALPLAQRGTAAARP